MKRRSAEGVPFACAAACTWLLVACGSESPSDNSQPLAASGSASLSTGAAASGAPSASGAPLASSTPLASSAPLASTSPLASSTAAPPMPVEFTLSSPAMASVAGCALTDPALCPAVPDQNASYSGGANVSPEFEWHGVPAGTRSFALTLTDVTSGQPHWAIWNLAADLTVLPADIPKDSAMVLALGNAVQSNATFAEGSGYFGPQAPCNVYEFEVFALSIEQLTPDKPEYVALVRSELLGLGDVVLARAKLTARTNLMQMCED